MSIGQKIKELRSAKMMTQQELAGDHITRNMLSRIENGFALPSLPSLLYIADRLGIPAGYLLSDGEEEFHYKKMSGMPDIMRAYTAGDWNICEDLCKNLGGNDNEIQYVLSLCLFNEAKDYFNAGDLRQAAVLFDSTKNQSKQTVYPVRSLIGECDTYLLCISSISPSLSTDIEIVSAPPLSSLSDPFCRYFSLLHYFDINSLSLLELFLNGDEQPEDEIYKDHITAKIKMKSGHFTDAYHLLKRILSSDRNIPAPMLYFVFTDLEVCCRELSDYRGAYEYSSDKTGMLEKFLG